jgi:uncharacterized protein YbcI
MDQSEKSKSNVAQQIAQAAIASQEKRTGRSPKSVAVVLGADTLVVTLHGALSPAEQALAQTPEGVAKLQNFHQQLFANSCGPLREEIKRISGTAVRETVAGTMVQVFQLAESVSADAWCGNDDDDPIVKTAA